MKKLMICILALVLVGCGEVVPPGKTVIILKPDGNNEIIEKGVFRAWGRDKLYFVDQKLKSFTEELKILCADDINMDVDIKFVTSFKVTEDSIEFIKQKVPAVTVGNVEGKELSLDQFYNTAVKDIIRSSARNVISASKTDDIRPNRLKLEAEISDSVIQRLTNLGYPLHVSAVMISNLDYPESVIKQRNVIKEAQLKDQEYAALAEAKLSEAKRQVAIEQEMAKVRMVKAQAQADENAILTKSLTPEFLMWRQLEVMENAATALSKGDGDTVFFMPYKALNPSVLDAALIRDGVKQAGK